MKLRQALDKAQKMREEIFQTSPAVENAAKTAPHRRLRPSGSGPPASGSRRSIAIPSISN